MRESVAERVGDLIDEVSRIEKESEGTYLALGKLFPALVSEMEKSAKNSRVALSCFSSIDGCSEESLRSMASFAKESSAYFRSVHERDAAFLQRINESIERLSSLEDLIGRVRSDSEEMEIISLNAMTVALKSGNAGKAFSVITDELKRLSSRTIGLTESITARGRELMACFGGLRDSLGELDEFQEKFFADLDRALGEGYQGIERDIREALGLFGGLLEEATRVRDPVQNIMQGIQLQDIIRQSLQHVTISLKEANKAADEAESIPIESLPPEERGKATSDRDDEFAFVASIAQLSASLLEEILGQLNEGVEGFGKEIEEVSSIISGVEARRLLFSNGYSSRLPSSTSERSFSESSARYLELKKKVIQTSRKLSEQVSGLDESFKGLAGLLSRFQNIVVASRIEVAKNRSLSGVANTVQGMVQLTERIGTDVGEAMDTTKDFIKVAYSAIVEYAGSDSAALGDYGASGSSGGEGDRLLGTLSRVERDIRSLDAAQGNVGGAIESFHLYTPEFIALIDKAREELAALRGFAGRLKNVHDEVAELETLIKGGYGIDLSTRTIRSERLKAMIDRFTIFTHKKTAGEIGNFEVEDGVAAGEVTLF
jgi:hypothetical protein